jgi:hypothetical protein
MTTVARRVLGAGGDHRSAHERHLVQRHSSRARAGPRVEADRCGRCLAGDRGPGRFHHGQHRLGGAQRPRPARAAAPDGDRGRRGCGVQRRVAGRRRTDRGVAIAGVYAPGVRLVATHFDRGRALPPGSLSARSLSGHRRRISPVASPTSPGGRPSPPRRRSRSARCSRSGRRVSAARSRPRRRSTSARPGGHCAPGLCG